MLKEKIENIKDFACEHRAVITAVVVGGITFLIGFKYGETSATLRMGLGLEDFHRKGFIRFFNPSTANEVDILEVNKLLRDYMA